MQLAAERHQLYVVAAWANTVGKQQHPQTASRLHHKRGAGKARVAKGALGHFAADEAVGRAGQVEPQTPVLILAGGVIVNGFFHGFPLQEGAAHQGQHAHKADSVAKGHEHACVAGIALQEAGVFIVYHADNRPVGFGIGFGSGEHAFFGAVAGVFHAQG